MTSGRWTRPRRCRWRTADGSLGCGSSTSAVAPCCGRSFSPRGRWSEVPPAGVQTQLRRTFTRRGRPERFRVDNGVPWGSAGDLPTDLALWLIGLGMGVDWNPPRRPQDNGVVEWSQGTAKRWAEPQARTGVVELQGRLEEMDDIRCREYPSVGGRSRWERSRSRPTRGVSIHRAGRGRTGAWKSHRRLSRRRQKPLSPRIVIFTSGRAARSRRTSSSSTARACSQASILLGRR